MPDYTPAPEAEIRELLEKFENRLQNISTWMAYGKAACDSAPAFALELLDRRKAMEEAPCAPDCASRHQCFVCDHAELWPDGEQPHPHACALIASESRDAISALFPGEQPRIWRLRNQHGVIFDTGSTNESTLRAWAVGWTGVTLVYSTDNGKTWVDEQAGQEGE